MPDDGIGASVLRKEDFRFLTGRGNYTDDINRPGQTHAVILRSPHAFAKINGIDISAAKSAPGVVAIFTGADMAADEIGGLPCGWLIHNKDGSPMNEPGHPPLVTDHARHVGDQVAVVIAETRTQARDAADLIEVDYEVLKACVDTASADKDDAAQVWPKTTPAMTGILVKKTRLSQPSPKQPMSLQSISSITGWWPTLLSPGPLLQNLIRQPVTTPCSQQARIRMSSDC